MPAWRSLEHAADGGDDVLLRREQACLFAAGQRLLGHEGAEDLPLLRPWGRCTGAGSGPARSHAAASRTAPAGRAARRAAEDPVAAVAGRCSGSWW